MPEGAPGVGAAGAAALPAATLGAAGVKLGRFCAKTHEDSIPIMANIIMKAMMRDGSNFFISKYGFSGEWDYFNLPIIGNFYNEFMHKCTLIGPKSEKNLLPRG